MSTVGGIEGLSSAIGDELTELAGFRSTRLTAQLLPEQALSSGLDSADYTQATSVLAGTWTWDGTVVVLTTDSTGVVVDDWIELDADGQFFQISGISLGTGPSGEDEVTILNPDSLTIPSGATGSSVVDPAVITLSSGTFDPAVASPHRFRVLAGTIVGEEALVDTRDSGVQVTLQTGLPASFSGVSWEIVIDPQTSASVETTLDWESSGTVYIDRIMYTYASKTLVTLDGLEHFDGEAFVDGAQRLHDVQSEVLDFTRNFSQ